MFVREIFGYLLLIKYYGKTENIVSQGNCPNNFFK